MLTTRMTIPASFDHCTYDLLYPRCSFPRCLGRIWRARTLPFQIHCPPTMTLGLMASNRSPSQGCSFCRLSRGRKGPFRSSKIRSKLGSECGIGPHKGTYLALLTQLFWQSAPPCFFGSDSETPGAPGIYRWRAGPIAMRMDEIQFAPRNETMVETITIVGIYVGESKRSRDS